MRAITIILTIVLGAIAISGCTSDQGYYKKYVSKSSSYYHPARLSGISPANVSGWDSSPKTFSSNSNFKTICSNNPFGRRCELEKSWQIHKNKSNKMWSEFKCSYGSRCWKQKNDKWRVDFHKKACDKIKNDPRKWVRDGAVCDQ